MIEIKAEPVMAEAFAPFGVLLPEPGDQPRLDHVADVANHRASAKANLTVVRAKVHVSPHQAGKFEKHPHSTQAFFPLDVARYLVVAAPDADGAPKVSAARAFLVPGSRAMSWRANVWHLPMAALCGAGVFAMLVHEDGGPEDTLWADVSPFRVVF